MSVQKLQVILFFCNKIHYDYTFNSKEPYVEKTHMKLWLLKNKIHSHLIVYITSIGLKRKFRRLEKGSCTIDLNMENKKC